MFNDKNKGVIPVTNTGYSSDELAKCYLDAFQHVFGNYGGEDGDKILVFVTNHVSSNSYLLAAEEELAKLEEVIMADSNIRDFIFMLQKVFFGRWVQGRGPSVIDSLVYDLALGLTISHLETPDPQAMILADAVVGTIPPIEQAKLLLSSNLWLIVAVLMPIYINVADIEAQVGKR